MRLYQPVGFTGHTGSAGQNACICRKKQTDPITGTRWGYSLFCCLIPSFSFRFFKKQVELLFKVSPKDYSINRQKLYPKAHNHPQSVFILYWFKGQIINSQCRDSKNYVVAPRLLSPKYQAARIACQYGFLYVCKRKNIKLQSMAFSGIREPLFMLNESPLLFLIFKPKS